MLKNKSIRIPSRLDVEDEIFVICMSEIEEFPNYITKISDIVNRYDGRVISSSFENLNLDSVRERANGDLINIEHHSSINDEIMRRDYGYCVSLHKASKKQVTPFIFYTGELPVDKVYHLNDLMFFSPIWFITQDINGNALLNNLKYKTFNQDEWNVYDILDFIWLPTFYNDLSIENLLLELLGLFNHIVAEDSLLDAAKRCLELWLGRWIRKSENKKFIMEVLNMSKLVQRPFEEVLEEAIITNCLEQFEEVTLERGRKEGREEGRKEAIKEAREEVRKRERVLISKLLDNHSPEEVSKDLDLPLDLILEIKYSK